MAAYSNSEWRSGGAHAMPAVAVAAEPSAASAQSSSAAAAAAEEAEVSHAPAANGYAKLVGADFTYTMRTKSLQIGRRMGQDRPGFLGISSAKNISRIHSEIRYIPHGRPNTAGYWQMTCVGKNGMQCNEDYMAPRENFKIKHKDRLQVGETAFFFLEPTPMSRTQTRE